MTMTEATGRSWFRGKQLALALLAATLAFAGATQALTPAPAAAMVNEGEECADPNYPSIDCETTGGGGAESGGGTSGSEGGGGGEIVGTVEVIEVEGTAPPSPCGTNCLPSQLGGGQQPGRDGGRNPHEPRHGGKATPDEKPQPAFRDCQKVMYGQLVGPLDQKLSRYSDLVGFLDKRVDRLFVQQEYLERERSRLEGLPSPSKGAIDGFTQAIRTVELERFHFSTRRLELLGKYFDMKSKRDEADSLRKKCRALYFATTSELPPPRSN